MKTIKVAIACTLGTLVTIAGSAIAQQRAANPTPARVYVFDCGLIKAMAVETYGFKQGEVPPKDFFVPCSYYPKIQPSAQSGDAEAIVSVVDLTALVLGVTADDGAIRPSDCRQD